jgi:hypothetical protein
MADLQQVVGAILRDLAKARFSSDLYSRSISRYYENDYLLRKFPVPRSDVEEVEIDLKFSIAEVLSSQVNAEGREANVAFLLERTVEELVATFLDLARAFTSRDENKDLAASLENLLTKGFNSTALRIELRQKVLRYFIESYTHLIGPQGDFNISTALRDLHRPFFYGLAEYREEGVKWSDLDDSVNRIFGHVFQQNDFMSVVESLSAPIQNIWQKNYDARLEVEVQGDKLAQLSDAAISTIKIKAVVRNMIWTEVKVDERKSRHALTSD